MAVLLLILGLAALAAPLVVQPQLVRFDVPVMIACGTFGFIAYLVGNSFTASYLQVNYVRDTGELAVVCGAVIGAGLGFLWFNAYPAQVFMGDVGALALGGALGTAGLPRRPLPAAVLADPLKRALRRRSGTAHVNPRARSARTTP